VASLNTSARELVLKIVFYGPGIGGKTTTLQAVHDGAPAERRGQLVSLATPVDRTLYFDFLPLRLPPMRGMSVRLQLFTVPGQVYFNATRRLVLSGADGLVFVADSQLDRADANLESLENLRDNLAEHGRDLGQIPHVFAWNKRDLDPAVPVEELERLLNRHHAPAFETVATSGIGVPETLAKITSLVLDAYEAQLPPKLDSSPPELGPPSSRTPATMAERRRPSRPAVDASAGLAGGRGDVEIETSAPPVPSVVSVTHEEAEVVTSAQLLASTEGTFLADLAAIEAGVEAAQGEAAHTRAREQHEDVGGGKESVVDEDWEEAAFADVHGPAPVQVQARALDAADARDANAHVVTPAPPRADAVPQPAQPGRITLRGSGLTEAIVPPPAHETAPAEKHFTFAQLFSPAERALVEQIEETVAHGDHADAIGVCEAALGRILGRVAHAIGDDGARGGSDASIAILLGLEGRRYLAFRALAKRARHVGDVGARDALEAYSFLLEARVLTSHWEALRDAVGVGSLPPPPPVRSAQAALDDLTPLPKSSLSPPSTRDQLTIRGGQ
jgi:signal recognition particle receptor subunit beta